MSTIDTLREYAEVWRLFGSMPDDATLSASFGPLPWCKCQNIGSLSPDW
jgi:hypothetical protein